MKAKKQKLFIILAAVFITNALLAELIGIKIFSLESSLGLSPANISILGYTLDFNLTAGVMLWPVVFITTDIINEYFGRRGVIQISLITVGCISYAFLVILLVTKLAPAQFWLDVNSVDANGTPFDMDYAFNKVFIQGMGIIAGSIIAFLIGQVLDAFIFKKLRRFTQEKMIWLRATGSTLVSQLIDSFVVLAIAFYFLAPEGAKWPFSQVISVGTLNYIYKFLVAVLLTPMVYLGHYLIDRYLGQDEAREVKGQASAS